MKIKIRIFAKKYFQGIGVLEPGIHELDLNEEQLEYVKKLPKTIANIVRTRKKRKGVRK